MVRTHFFISLNIKEKELIPQSLVHQKTYYHAHSSFIFLYKFTASGQEIDHGDQFGRTPLMFTILADRLECAELLLRAGANVNSKDKGGRTALHWAAHKVGARGKEIN